MTATNIQATVKQKAVERYLLGETMREMLFEKAPQRLQNRRTSLQKAFILMGFIEEFFCIFNYLDLLESNCLKNSVQLKILN